MSHAEGKKEALKLAFEKIKNINIAERCRLLSLGEVINEKLEIKAFGRDYIFNLKNFLIIDKLSGIEPADDLKIIILHYLYSEVPYRKSDNQISFREFKGGQFYWTPFMSRTAVPLAKRINNDTILLREKIKTKYEYTEIKLGDFAAKIHAIGNIYITVIYHSGDDEFPPEVDITFDEYTKWVYSADDAVFLASKICLSLL
jgi:hypothetical protein